MAGFDLDKPVQLVPVSQWVYDLYKVSYWSDDPALPGSRKLKETYIAASSENHMQSDADRHAPNECWYSWEVVRSNVGQPRVVGSIYGQSVYEDGLTHGRRLMQM